MKPRSQPAALLVLLLAPLGGVLLWTALFTATAVPALQVTPAGADTAEPAGQGVFLAQKCNLCHSVEAAGIASKAKSEKLRARDLSTIATEHDAAYIRAVLHRERQIDGKDHKKEFKGSDEELAALIDWLGEVAAGAK